MSGKRIGLTPRPASDGPGPEPPPLMAPTGELNHDVLAHFVNQNFQAARRLPEQSTLQKLETVVNTTMSVLNGEPLVQFFNYKSAQAISQALGSGPSLPAAIAGSKHLGIPHVHMHPPAFPIPLPSYGSLRVGGAANVLINGKKSFRAGDLGLAFTCGSLTPPFEIMTGSSSVFIAGSRASRVFDVTGHCGALLSIMQLARIAGGAGIVGTAAAAVMGSVSNLAITAGMGKLSAAAATTSGSMQSIQQQTSVDLAKIAMSALAGKDLGMPPVLGVILDGSSNVMIGGFPIPPIEDVARGFLQNLVHAVIHVVTSPLRKVFRWAGRRLNRWATGECHWEGHPVDVATGRLFTQCTDVSLDGIVPLVFERKYFSSWSERDSALGWGWTHTYDQAVWIEDHKVVYKDHEGREVEFDTHPFTDGVMRAGDVLFDKLERLTLRCFGNFQWQVETLSGSVSTFAPVPGGQANVAYLQSVRNRVGHAVKCAYDEAGRLVSVTDPVGRVMWIQYDPEGKIKRLMVPHPSNNEWMTIAQYSYSEQGDLVAVSDALGHTRKYEYNLHLMSKETDRCGLSFFFEYEGSGHQAKCVKTWGDGGIYLRKLIYDTNTRSTIVMDSYGKPTIYVMDHDGLVVRKFTATAATTQYHYDRWARKTAEIDPLERATQYAYDEVGNVTQVLRADGTRVKFAYNDLNQVVWTQDANGQVWTTRYNAVGQVIEARNPCGEVVKWEYGEHGLLSSVTLPGGGKTQLAYDPVGLVCSVMTANGAMSNVSRDLHGRIVSQQNPKGAVEKRVYDDGGRVIEAQHADGELSVWKYNPEGYPVSLTRADGRVTRWKYKGNHQLASETYPDGSTVKLLYNLDGVMVGVVNEQGDTYRFEVNADGQVVKETGFDSGVRRYTRDKAGQVVKIQMPSGKEIKQKFDAVGRLVRVDYQDGNHVQLLYRSDGALMDAINNDVHVKFERDALGRVTKEWQNEHWIASRYDNAGHRLEWTSSLGARVVAMRDALGNVTDISVGELNTPWQAHFEYDQLGAEIARYFPGGVVGRRERDSLGRPTAHHLRKGDTMLASVGYQWTAGSKIRAMVDAQKGPTQYTHDQRDRLIAAKYPDGTTQYRIADRVGNIFKQKDKTDREYLRGGMLKRVEDVAYKYDPDGQLVEKELPDGTKWLYQWNDAGKLVAVKRPDKEVIEFAYDAFSRRVRKKSKGNDTRFVWDGHTTLHEVVNKREVTTWVFEPESFTPLLKIEGNKRYGVATDHLGTPTELFDERGNIAWKAQLDVYGVLHADVAAVDCPWRWPGQYEDNEVELSYNRFRNYDSVIGMFLSIDPVRLWASSTLYSYPADPHLRIDPLGLIACPPELKPNLIAATFQKYFGVLPDEIFLVGTHAEGVATANSDIDIVIVTLVPGLNKFRGPGFEFFRTINPGRIPATATSMDHLNIGGNIAKAGLIDPFFVSHRNQIINSPSQPAYLIWADPLGSQRRIGE